MNTPIIDISDITKHYGKARGVNHISLQVTEGEIFGFIGPNGAGKSTTIRILLNLIFPNSGSARIMGMDVINDAKKIKQVTGYIPSDASAYPSMEVNDFLNYCLRYYGTENGTKRLSELAGLFEVDLKRKIADLSLGNRKKVSIIQSMLHNPKLLIVDEPTMGLDPLMQSRFFDQLRSENQRGMTIFFSSHILSDIQTLCRRVAIIREGSIIRVEEIEALRKRQLKKVHLQFESRHEKESFHIDGIEQLIQSTDNSIAFMYSGDLHELIVTCAHIRLTDMTVEEPSLEEVFMHYYQ
jgi:ABC-2 type transport system ATP-binding protein